MTTVGDILDYLETLAPRSMKMDWDNAGLLCGGKSRPVTKVLVALDPFEGVCREAEEWGAELIVTHHPLIFNPLKAVTDETALGRSIQLLCAAGISAVNAHTNLDCAPGGVNDCLAAALGLRDVRVIDPQVIDNGTGRIIFQNSIQFDDTVRRKPAVSFSVLTYISTVILHSISHADSSGVPYKYNRVCRNRSNGFRLGYRCS